LQDELEKAKLALITDARKKELATAQESFDDYREKFLIERTKDEKAALDKQFIDGKISREKYNAELLDLQKNASNKLTDTEREIIILKERKLLQDVAAINKKFDAQELKDLAEKEKRKLIFERYSMHYSEISLTNRQLMQRKQMKINSRILMRQ
jgi:hypothetical protein